MAGIRTLSQVNRHDDGLKRRVLNIKLILLSDQWTGRMTTISTGLSETEAYRVCAIGHLNAAKLLHDRLNDIGLKNTDSTWLALQSLIGFAAENALKTYLSSHGVARNQLKKRDFGHDLNAILTKSVELGLETDGTAISQPNLASALRRYTELCGEDFTSFNYRYLEGENVQVLSAGEATTTVIRAIECVIDISAEKAASEASIG